MRIIEVYIARLHIVFAGSNVKVIDERLGNGFDCRGVLYILLGPGQLGYHDWLAMGGKSGYYFLRKRRARDDGGDYWLEGHGADDAVVITNGVARALLEIVRLR